MTRNEYDSRRLCRISSSTHPKVRAAFAERRLPTAANAAPHPHSARSQSVAEGGLPGTEEGLFSEYRDPPISPQPQQSFRRLRTCRGWLGLFVVCCLHLKLVGSSTRLTYPLVQHPSDGGAGPPVHPPHRPLRQLSQQDRLRDLAAGPQARDAKQADLAAGPHARDAEQAVPTLPPPHIPTDPPQSGSRCRPARPGCEAGSPSPAPTTHPQQTPLILGFPPENLPSAPQIARSPQSKARHRHCETDRYALTKPSRHSREDSTPPPIRRIVEHRALLTRAES
eukprot:1194574-Prorocentrum_minimum.AAC.9